MNRVGMLIDLSHVGAKTSEDAIHASERPVAYSHCCPAAPKDHPRNKTDAQLRQIAHKRVRGVTMFPPFLPRGAQSTIEDYLDVIEYTINVVGEEQVGIGTDFTQGHGESFPLHHPRQGAVPQVGGLRGDRHAARHPAD